MTFETPRESESPYNGEKLSTHVSIIFSVKLKLLNGNKM